MSGAAWFDEEEGPRTQVRDRDDGRDAWDTMQPSAMVRHVEEDVAGLAALAREVPRDLNRLREAAREIGARLGALLDARGEGTRAYYRWKARNKDGTEAVIEGPTVDLMREIAGEWGGLICRVERIAQHGQDVTLRGRVLDVARIFAVQRDYEGWLRPPPARFQGEEAGRWKTMQLQAAESKALRGVLEDIVPAWLIEEALEAARDAAAEARLGGRSLPEAVKKSVEALAKVGLTDVEQLTRWVGRPPSQWTALDLGQLRDLYARAKRGELPPDALRVEAAQREAARQAEATEDGTAPSGDRLDGLGLGKGPQQQPQGQQGQAGGGSPAAGSDAGGASTGTAAGQSSDPGKAPPIEGVEARAAALHAAVRDRLPMPLEQARGVLREVARLGRVYDGPWLDVQRHGEQHGWWKVEAGSMLPPAPKQSTPTATAPTVPSGPVVVPDPWPGPDGTELSSAILALLDRLPEVAAERAAARVGAGENPTAEQSRAILVALREEEAALAAEVAAAERGSP